MGYGTVLTPVLLLFNFDPIVFVPAVLLSEIFANLVSSLFHVLLKNITLGSNKDTHNSYITSECNPHNSSNTNTKTNSENENNNINTPETAFQRFICRLRNLTEDTKIIIIMAVFGVIATIVSSILNAVFAYSTIATFIIKIYIGVMVLSMGGLILIMKPSKHFSIRKVVFFGALAGFNKGLSGGGYGPITVSGQLISGRDGRQAIGTTSLSEGITCVVGFITYIITEVIYSNVNDVPFNYAIFELTSYLIVGVVLAAPLAALTVKKIENEILKKGIAIATAILGILTLLKAILSYVGIW
ncbi:MAG: sulfite exporter TauE/SafE family protein [Asgard group archaeon]|nr:sulfite exporter TauE/SafE family protein [Asgard group archaeon]